MGSEYHYASHDTYGISTYSLLEKVSQLVWKENAREGEREGGREGVHEVAIDVYLHLPFNLHTDSFVHNSMHSQASLIDPAIH